MSHKEDNVCSIYHAPLSWCSIEDHYYFFIVSVTSIVFVFFKEHYMFILWPPLNFAKKFNKGYPLVTSSSLERSLNRELENWCFISKSSIC